MPPYEPTQPEFAPGRRGTQPAVPQCAPGWNSFQTGALPKASPPSAVNRGGHRPPPPPPPHGPPTKKKAAREYSVPKPIFQEGWNAHSEGQVPKKEQTRYFHSRSAARAKASAPEPPKPPPETTQPPEAPKARSRTLSAATEKKRRKQQLDDEINNPVPRPMTEDEKQYEEMMIKKWNALQ